MTHASVHTMLDTYPKDLGNIDQHKLAECIDTCLECAQTCTACADACLSEDMVAELAKCIRTNLDCADICLTTGNILFRHTGYDANITRAVLEACQTVCRACADECERHAGMHEHCRVCAEACHRGEQACAELLASLG
ncbi:four-helix bundle copper-binding protein [Pseudarthrobacter sp. CC12]|uniref:four-helix bundle copper-binding protein n=1 Tax=unclassified Pseudarthrobacter TaxID=2647000 RepID=UPI0014037406|nr:MULTISPECIES: four-helix bundle copper-binding protein [unclassified Pseudarthrobacter]